MSEPVPNEREHAVAYDLERRPDRREIARCLALAREGEYLEGPRKLVSGVAQLPRSAYEGPDRERALEQATAYAWRSWFDELRREGLRPCGWPAVQHTYVATPTFSMQPINGARPSWVEVEPGDERAEYLVVSVTCEAVPAGEVSAPS